MFGQGGHIVYICKPKTGIPFAMIRYANTLKSDPPGHLETFAKSLIYNDMQPPAPIDAVTCTTQDAPAFAMTCSIAEMIDGSRMQQRGRFVVSGDNFLSFTWACLDQHCAAAGKVMDALEKTILRDAAP
jgi:hypothetical protein